VLLIFLVKGKSRQAVYVEHNTEVHLHNHCCCGNTMSIEYYECVSIALVIQHGKCMCNIVLSSLVCLTTIFFHIVS